MLKSVKFLPIALAAVAIAAVVAGCLRGSPMNLRPSAPGEMIASGLSDAPTARVWVRSGMLPYRPGSARL
jgi:hypothetical protein